MTEDFECPKCGRVPVAVVDVVSVGTGRQNPAVKGEVHREPHNVSSGSGWRLYVHEERIGDGAGDA